VKSTKGGRSITRWFSMVASLALLRRCSSRWQRGFCRSSGAGQYYFSLTSFGREPGVAVGGTGWIIRIDGEDVVARIIGSSSDRRRSVSSLERWSGVFVVPWWSCTFRRWRHDRRVAGRPSGEAGQIDGGGSPGPPWR
jgi:hypothetical protein